MCIKSFYTYTSLTLYGVDYAYQQNGGHSRQFAHAYQKFVTEISRSETSGRIDNLW